MEFGAREMMMVLGTLVVLAIVLDVIRRIRCARYEKIHMPRRKQPIFEDEQGVDKFGSELPGGGARVIGYRDEVDVEKISKTVREKAEANRPKLSIPTRAPEQPGLDLDSPKVEPAKESSKVESTANDKVSREPPAAATQQAVKQVPVASVVVLHLMAKSGELFDGEQLLEALLSQGLRYGSMKIFHRHEGEGGTGNVIYSVANSVNPGTFDLNSMSDMTTPGISLFFAMEDVKDPSATLRLFFTSAKEIADVLNGELKDESRSAFTRQTEDHYRQRVADFSRSQLSEVE